MRWSEVRRHSEKLRTSELQACQKATIFTQRDIPGENVIHTLDTDTQIFCTEEVHYAGEPVGILVGPDIQKVRKLASEIQLTFDIQVLNNVYT